MSLNDICYELIKDSFHYGTFGEFTLVIDKNTGCFNATKLCKQGNKDFSDWSRLKRSQELLKFYNKNRPPYLGGGFYEIKTGNKDLLNKQISGQYVRKELILDIASWISVEFYDKCSQIVNDYFVNQYQQQINEANQLVEETKQQLEEANQRIEEAEEQILCLKELAVSDTHLEQTQIIYIATSPNYAKRNRFKSAPKARGGEATRRCSQ
jgi:hypothetical protein